MGELKLKKTVRRRALAANSPEPTGPVPPTDPACGHGGCGMECKVRYVGPTSHMRDHHIVHAARGMTHVWTAAIVTGFAIVLTGAVAFNAVQAKTSTEVQDSQAVLKEDLTRSVQTLSERISVMEESLKRVEASCQGASSGQ